MTKLIVLDQMINSMTEFKQIIGRGTRLREKDGKTHFTVMDFRGCSRLFADPDWDGPIEITEGFVPPEGGGEPKTPPTPPSTPRYIPRVTPEGCRVEIISKIVSVYDANGKLLRQESITDYTKTNVLGEYASLENFIKRWRESDNKSEIRDLLADRGIDLELMKQDEGLSDVDDFDYICHVAFDKKPLTRRERANNVKKRDFLSKYNGVAKDVLETLLEKYADTGVYEIENTDILKIEPLNQFGAPAKIVKSFGGKAEYLKAIKELEAEIYSAA